MAAAPYALPMPPSPPRSAVPEFDLTSDDPLDRLQRRLRLKVGSPAAPGRRIVLLLVVTVLPLVVLAGIAGQLGTLATDTLVIGRLVIALPLLVLAGPPVARAVRHAVEQCVKTGLVGAEDRDRFEAAVTGAIRLRDSRLALAVIVVIALVVSVGAGGANLPYIGDWAREGGGLSAAGWWFALVSMSLFDLVRLRWLWRVVVWWRFLFSLARLPPGLMPAHPDRAGGLGFLSVACGSFAALILAMGIGPGIGFRGAILAGDATLATLKVPMIGVALLLVLVVAAPLLFFLPLLGRAKRRAALEYGQLAARYTRRFDARWIGEGERHDAELLGSGDIQSLADLQGSYDVVQQMRPVPISLPTIVTLLLMAGIAMLPAIEAEVPLKDILIAVLGALR